MFFPMHPLRLRPGIAGCLALGVGALLATVTPAASQAAPPPEAPDSVAGVSYTPASEANRSGLEERWAAPFAVERTGRPPARSPRPVVVLRDSAAARRVAEAQVAAGESAAEVSVEAEAGAASSTSATRQSGAAVRRERQGASAAAEERPAVGATARAGSAPAVPAAGRTATAESPRTHRVEYGETWYGILREYRVSSGRLAAANPDVDPERLRAGTVLRIPASGEDAPVQRTHKVGSGDTLYGIARRYGVTPAAIRSANHMSGDVVKLGQTLVIPREETSR